jgi:hypothetical protein
VLTDPGSLDDFHGQQARQRDLLELYTASDAGDAVAAEGVAIPVLGVEPGYYAITIRTESDSSPLSDPPFDMSTGWVLQVSSGEVVLAGVGYLKNWDPEHPKLRRVALEPGWYSVDIFVGAATNGDDFALDFVLRACAARPQFSADLGWTPNMSAATPRG